MLSMTALLWSSCVFKIGKDDEPDPPEQEYEQPVTHVYSDDSSTEAIVKEVRADGTVVLDAATAKEIPQVGEIIVSGVTDAAPEGFLYHVESVQQSGGNVTIKTSPATLNEVLPDASFEQPLQFSLADDEENATLNQPKSNGIRPRGDFDLLDWTVKLSFKKELGDKVVISDWLEKSQYISVDGSLKLKLGGSFIWDCKNGWPYRCGFTLDGSTSAQVTVEAAVKVEPKDVEKYRFKLPKETKLKPIAFTILGVPVVIVPTVQYYVGILSSSGKAYIKFKPLDFETLGFDSRLIWCRDAIYSNKHWDYGFTPKSDFVSKSAKDLLVDALNADVGLTGEVKFFVGPYLRLKLYNADNVSLATAISPYMKTKGELAVKYQASALDFSVDDIEIKDNLSLSLGLAVPMEGKLQFNILGQKIGGTLSEDLNIIEKPLIEGATLFPVFNDFVMSPEDDVKNSPFVHVKAKKGSTLLSIFSSFETDYGFCYAQIKKDYNGNELPREWKYISLKSNYPATSVEYKIEADIPTSNLVENATYDVRPYWTMKMGSFSRIWKRKGGKFKTGGATSNGNGAVVPDVPGLQL